MQTASKELFVWGASHHRTAQKERSTFSLTEKAIQTLYSQLTPRLDACLILDTCNRVEIYAVSSQNATATKLKLTRCLEKLEGFHLDNFCQDSFYLSGQAALSHLFQVACGTDSQLVGETEILSQLKKAYKRATEEGHAERVLHHAFQKSFQAAKWVHTHTDISSGPVSLGNITLSLAERVCGRLESLKILLLGTGQAGQNIALALQRRCVKSCTILSADLARAAKLAETLQNVAIAHLSQLPLLLEDADMVIGATRVEERCFLISVEMLKQLLLKRREHPLFAIDTAVPPNFHPHVQHLESVYLYNLDSLGEFAKNNEQSRLGDIEKARQVARVRAEKCYGQLKVWLSCKA